MHRTLDLFFYPILYIIPFVVVVSPPHQQRNHTQVRSLVESIERESRERHLHEKMMIERWDERVYGIIVVT